MRGKKVIEILESNHVWCSRIWFGVCSFARHIWKVDHSQLVLLLNGRHNSLSSGYGLAWPEKTSNQWRWRSIPRYHWRWTFQTWYFWRKKVKVIQKESQDNWHKLRLISKGSRQETSFNLLQLDLRQLIVYVVISLFTPTHQSRFRSIFRSLYLYIYKTGATRTLKYPWNYSSKALRPIRLVVEYWDE